MELIYVLLGVFLFLAGFVLCLIIKSILIINDERFIISNNSYKEMQLDKKIIIDGGSDFNSLK